MDEHKTKLRNIGLIAHVDAGKTTLSERILFYCQAIQTMGEVSEGTAVMDYLPEEQKRGITIGAACISCYWQKVRINLVDTPGHVDFTGEVGRTLRVIDGAVVVFSAVDGVEPQSETVWRQADQFHLPRLVFINKVDRKEADFANVVAEMKRSLRGNFALVTLPLYDQDQNLTGILDLLKGKELFFDHKSLGAKVTQTEIKPEHLDLAKKHLDVLLAAVAEADAYFFDLWGNNTWNRKDLDQAIARASRHGKFIPIYCGAAKANFGVQPLLDGIVKYLPDPQKKLPNLLDAYGHKAKPKMTSDDALGFVFKVASERGKRLAWMRIYAGQINTGDSVYISRDHTLKAPIQLYRLDAEQYYELEQARAGDIVAFTGPSVRNGDTCTLAPEAVFLEPLPNFDQVIAQRIEPRADSDYELLERALNRYCDEDLTLSFERDENSGAFIVQGMGELHLNILRDRLKREYDLTPIWAKPTVICRESIGKEAFGTSDFILPIGDFSQHGAVSLKVVNRQRGQGNCIKFANALLTDCRPDLLAAARSGVQNILGRGILADWPVIDVEVELLTILDNEDVSALGTQAAAERALTSALQEAKPFLLQPIMRVTIVVPADLVGRALTCFSAVGTVKAVQEKSDRKVIDGEAPLENLLELATKLRSVTKGLANLSLEFLKFAAK